MWRSMKDSKFVVIGEIVSPQGNRGEVKVIPYTERPERFFEMESVLLFAENSAEPAGLFAIEGCREHKGAIVLKLEGVDTISEAEDLRKMLIKLSVDELEPLPPGRYYVFQLIGLECKPSQERNWCDYRCLADSANDVYVIKPYAGVTKLREVLIPVIPK